MQFHRSMQSRLTCSQFCFMPCINYTCPHMQAVKFDDTEAPIDETICSIKPQSRECYKAVCPTCKNYTRKHSTLF